MTKKKTGRKRNPRAIERVCELLQDVLGAFDMWYGIGPPAVKKAASEITDSHQVEAPDHAEEEDDEYGAEPEYYFDVTDIQGSLKEAITSIINEELIDEFKDPEEAPTLSDIFAVLFGPGSELAEQAEYFEELISGYEDRAHVDDLKEACNILVSIVDEITPKRA
ncbi:MAG: hypothetical protein ABSG08_13045 [Terriglobales bacterium]|jgi:hypothetical protein